MGCGSPSRLARVDMRRADETDRDFIADQIAGLMWSDAWANRRDKRTGCSFERARVPSTTMEKYARRFVNLTCITGEAMVAAWIYVHRALESGKAQLNPHTAHQLFATAMCAAVKYHDDDVWHSKGVISDMAKVAGINAKELARLEVHLIKECLDWRLAYTVEEHAVATRKIKETSYDTCRDLRHVCS